MRFGNSPDNFCITGLHQDMPTKETSLYYPARLRNTFNMMKPQSESKKVEKEETTAVDDEDIKVKDLKTLLHRVKILELSRIKFFT